MSINAFEITTGSQLHGVQTEWFDLCKRCSATPFMGPQWLINWWDTFGNDNLRAIAFKFNGGELIALGLFFIYNSDHGRTLSFVGSGISDYSDVLIDKRFVGAVLPRIFDYFQSIQSLWDIVDLQQLRASSLLFSETRNNHKFQSLISIIDVCPVIRLPLQKDELIRLITSKKLRRNIRYGTARLRQMGQLQMEVADVDSVGAYLEDLFALHASRWKIKQEDGILTSRKVKEFHRRVAGEMVRTQQLRLYRFRLSGRVCACFYILIQGHSSYGYIGGFDPSLSKFSLGSICLYKIMQDLVGRDIYLFDFLRGAEGYKYGWGASKSYNYRLLLSHGGN